MKKLLILPACFLTISATGVTTALAIKGASQKATSIVERSGFSVSNSEITATSSNEKLVMLYDEKAKSTSSISFNLDLNVLSGGSAGIVFGVRDNEKPIDNGYYSLTYSNNEFTFYRYLLGRIGKTTYKEEFISSGDISLKVEITSSSRIKCTANETVIFDMFDYDYQGGYFGYYIENGSASYKNYQVQLVDNTLALIMVVVTLL